MGTSQTKKANISDPSIRIRILKALNFLRPVGLHKDLILLTILKKFMKKPNIITVDTIWEFCVKEFAADQIEKDDWKRYEFNGYEKLFIGVIKPVLEEKKTMENEKFKYQEIPKKIRNIDYYNNQFNNSDNV